MFEYCSKNKTNSKVIILPHLNIRIFILKFVFILIPNELSNLKYSVYAIRIYSPLSSYPNNLYTCNNDNYVSCLYAIHRKKYFFYKIFNFVLITCML